MKIKMKTSMAGIDFACKPGDIIEIKDKWAMNLINSGQAELVKETHIETAEVVQDVETAVKPKRKKKS